MTFGLLWNSWFWLGGVTLLLAISLGPVGRHRSSLQGGTGKRREPTGPIETYFPAEKRRR